MSEQTKQQAGALAALVTPGQEASKVDAAGTPLAVVCGSVRGSGPLAAEPTRRGFTPVVPVEGGFPARKDAVGRTGR